VVSNGEQHIFLVFVLILLILCYWMFSSANRFVVAGDQHIQTNADLTFVRTNMMKHF
jgi:hypothetical protein